jgi:3-hydroxyisobutyrate dehydrogenase
VNLGFVGLGNLGSHLAASLVRAGFDVTVHDLDRARGEALVSAGAAWSESPRTLAERSDTVLTCLPSPAAVAAVVEGPDGVLAGLRAGGAWIDTSTSEAGLTARLAVRAAARGIGVLEAPVTGGVHLAASAGITVIAGGDRALFDRHRDVLQALGRRVFYAGPLGRATALKVITNMLAFVHLAAAGEALMLAGRAGLDLRQAYEVICASSGTSFVFETEAQLVLNGSYDIGFTIDLALKDLGFASGLGETLGVPLELEPLVERLFERARDAYGGGAPSTMAVKLLEDAVGADLRAPGFPSRLTAGDEAVRLHGLDPTTTDRETQ